MNSAEDIHASGRSSVHVGDVNHTAFHFHGDQLDQRLKGLHRLEHRNEEIDMDKAGTSSSTRAIECTRKGGFLVPFGRNHNFIGREAILSQLQDRIWPGKVEDDCQRTTIEGLGGVGKTQIALEAIYRLHKEHPETSIFWVPAVDAPSFEIAYRNIGSNMGVKGINEDAADIRRLVKDFLEGEVAGSWLLVIDNADDEALILGTNGLSNHLPFSRKGSILFTTRNHKVAVRLGSENINVMGVEDEEAIDMLHAGLTRSQIVDKESSKRLLHFLTNLPLAVRQASAFIAENQMTTAEYLELCESEPRDFIDLLSQDFDDQHRYKQIQNPVITTWLVSFGQILLHDPLAAEYLKFMSLFSEKDIPQDLLPPAKRLESAKAIGTLKAYAFISEREGQRSFDMHRLVRLAMQQWLKRKGELDGYAKSAIERLNGVFPNPNYLNVLVWKIYESHAEAVLGIRETSTDHTAVEAVTFKLAECYSLYGQYLKSEKAHRVALALKEKRLGSIHRDTLVSMMKLTDVLRKLERCEEAWQTCQQALGLDEGLFNPEHPEILVIIIEIANMLCKEGKHQEAVEIYRKILTLEGAILRQDTAGHIWVSVRSQYITSVDNLIT